MEDFAKHAGDLAGVAQALVVIVSALAALWSWFQEKRHAGIRELVPAVVALVQDAARDYAAVKAGSGSKLDKAKLAAEKLQELARKRGLSLSPAEVEYHVSMASALHKANKLAEEGYINGGAPGLEIAATATADPKAAPGN